jgi:hypothetical protein
LGVNKASCGKPMTNYFFYNTDDRSLFDAPSSRFRQMLEQQGHA